MNVLNRDYRYKSAAADFSKGHKHINAGCFYCLKRYPVSQITEYTDGGRTAICPHCSIDSVVGDCGEELPSQEIFNVWYIDSFDC
jgi:hypothetical protein